MSERQEQYQTQTLTAETLAALAEQFKPEHHETLRQGGTAITFVSWNHYVERLNEVVPNWSMGDPIFREVGGKLAVGLPITICGVTRTNFGDEDADKDTFGTAVVNAYAQAFKRTCAMFGLGLYLYNGADAPQPTARPTKAQQKRAASSEVQADKSTEPLVRPDGWASVTVTHPDWPGMQDWLCKKTSYYMQDGEPNPYHMLATLAKEGITEVSEENAKKVLAVLLGYAEKN